MADMKWKREKKPFKEKCEYRCGDFTIHYSEKHKTSGGFPRSSHWTLWNPKMRLRQEFDTLKEAKEAAQKILEESN